MQRVTEACPACLCQVIGMGDTVIPWDSLEVLYAGSINKQTGRIDFNQFLDGFQASLHQVETTSLYAQHDWLQCVFYDLDEVVPQPTA